MKPISRTQPMTLAALLAVAVAVALHAAPARAADPPDPLQTARLHDLFDADWQRQLREDPLTASDIGDPRYNDRLPNLSPEAIAAQHAAVRESLAALEAIARSALSPDDQLDYDIYHALLVQRCVNDGLDTEPDTVAEQLRLHLHRGIGYLFGPFDGLYVRLFDQF